MGRGRSIKVESLTQLQRQMLRLETAIEPRDVKPVLAAALKPTYDKSVENLRGLGVRLGGRLRLPGQQHIENALYVSEGKSSRMATAFLKLSRKFAPQGVWLEYGHVLWRGGTRRKGTGKQIGEVRKRPFFRPAIDTTKREVIQRIESGIKKLIERFTTRY